MTTKSPSIFTNSRWASKSTGGQPLLRKIRPHAREALVPHHGTLLRVSPDGKKTDIVATGFGRQRGLPESGRHWIVTDQEGHWNPKNRINSPGRRVLRKHDGLPRRRGHLRQHATALGLITNAFDRSPAELLWVPENGNWGELNGRLLNLSYGYGMAYPSLMKSLTDRLRADLPFRSTACPRASPRPLSPRDSGPVRGRDVRLGGSQRGDGGLYRIRKTENRLHADRTGSEKEKASNPFSDKLPNKGSFSEVPGTSSEPEVTDPNITTQRSSRLPVTQSRTIGWNLRFPTLPDLVHGNKLRIRKRSQARHPQQHPPGDGRQTCLALIDPHRTSENQPSSLL